MNRFITLTFFLTIIAVTTALWTKQDMKDHLKSRMEECLDDPDMGFPEDVKEKFRKNMRSEIGKEMKMKMAECMMKKKGFISKEGEIMIEVMKEKIAPKMKDPSKFDEMMEICNKKMESIGRTSMKMFECMETFHETKCGC